MGIIGTVILLCLVTACRSVTQDSLEQQDISLINRGYRFQNPISSTPHSPWISGPLNRKYQFHVGQQSWLAAREICLTNNADLTTIETQEQLNWILSHYRPQFSHTAPRQIQVGVFADMEDGDNGRIWRWVNMKEMNNTLLPWSSGEPFDHSNGRERCGLLNVNRRTLEDVDCDLGGTPTRFYRFICERTMEQHLKHEELNNPLWKKLEDILSFFGISERTKANLTESSEQVKPTAIEDYDEANLTRVVPTEKNVVKEDNIKIHEERPKYDDKIVVDKTVRKIQPNQVFAAKTVSTKDDADLLIATDLELFRQTNTSQPVEPVIGVEEVTPSGQRTTKADPLSNLADTLEASLHEAASKVNLDSQVHNLERILNAVEKIVGDEKRLTMKQKESVISPEVRSTLALDKETTTVTPLSSTESVDKVQFVEARQRLEVDENTVDLKDNEQIEISHNVEGDFEQAYNEQQANPGVNSGDLLNTFKEDELIGCGAKNLKGTGGENVTAETKLASKKFERKGERIEQFLTNLKQLLDGASHENLTYLLDSQSDLSLSERLELASKLARTTVQTPPSEAELSQMRAKIEDDVLKSIEALGEAESKEFVSLEDTKNELEAIGSGLEPPAEKLISLGPAAIQGHGRIEAQKPDEPDSALRLVRVQVKDGQEIVKANEKLHHIRGMEVLSSKEALESISTIKNETTITAAEDPENDGLESWTIASVVPSDAAKNTSDIPESEEEDEQKQQPSKPFGKDSDDPTRGNDNSTKQVKKPVDGSSLFPPIDFGLLANKKLQQEAQQRAANEKSLTDRAYNDLNKRLVKLSLAERIAASEIERKLVEEKRTLPKVKKTNVPLGPKQKSEDLVKQLEHMFYDWSHGAFGVLAAGR